MEGRSWAWPRGFEPAGGRVVPPREAEREVERMLTDSVRAMLLSDRPLGILLSAVKASGKIDRKAVRDSLLAVPAHDGVTGALRFTPEGAGDPVKSVEVLADRYLLNDNERAGVLRHLITQGDLSGYGLVNAVTHYSEEVEDYDRATEFEAIGGKLIELPSKEWQELAEAA